jgi:hypothetical protein
MVLRGVAETRYYYPPYDYECPSSPVQGVAALGDQQVE